MKGSKLGKRSIQKAGDVKTKINIKNTDHIIIRYSNKLELTQSPQALELKKPIPKF